MSEAPLDQPKQRPRSLGRTIAVLAPLALFAGLAVLFLVSLERGGDPSLVPSVLIGKPAPATDLKPVEGLALPGLSTADLSSGKPMLVNVWASWCAPCRQEHPVLERLAQDPRLTLVGINYKDQPDNARAFLGQLGNPFARIGADPTGRTAIDWGVYGVPESFLVDGKGVIRFKFIGPLTDEAVASTLMPELDKIANGG
ncbi:cytochrome c biogenesis protein CcmG, thiol:disulfide interchange protein DsbE [Kaistia soli DSM 19436]|uniref:Cytochrome c biogenesis protein CcmG, thiol:disulfide interchange protein DsbE n=1 Tax=Kaistia soli DSM 19436 TaxID=1122133 RepID=A0A1M5CT50_9HYPH|nr:DsbE family thiol:disulfide interchange protein [Kaistia soli]SHF57929.1 cytochrome c biogenesis protein CcmG, thiol:disulfide interchange protein DsbE [Kaistia soli DSM 19436]